MSLGVCDLISTRINELHMHIYLIYIETYIYNISLSLGLKPSTTGAVLFGIVGDYQKEEDDQDRNRRGMAFRVRHERTWLD